MFSSRLSLLALLAASSMASASFSKPYAPDLYSRSELTEGGNSNSRVIKRMSQPYAPDLYSRSEVEEVALSKRSPSPALEATTSSWSPLEFLGIREYSEEELHARGKISDAEIEKRGHCDSDSSCASTQYCSSKKHKCYKKLSNGKHCSRNEACKTGNCCTANDTCQDKLPIGGTCGHNDGSCYSGYCSVKTDTCQNRGSSGDKCWVDGGCKDGYSCVNKSCVKNSPKGGNHGGNHGGHGGGHGHHPHHPSPSGTPQRKRSLRPVQ